MFSADAGSGVGNSDVELKGTFADGLAVSDGDVVGDFGAVSAVVHHEQVEVIDVVNEEFDEAVGEEVLGLLGGTITDLDLFYLRFFPLADTRVNTSGLSP